MARRLLRSGWRLLLGCLLATSPVLAAAPAETLAWRSAPVLRHFGVAEGLPQVSANVLLRTHDGFLWVGTFGGLVRFDGGEFRAFRSGEGDAGPASRRIVALHEDATHRLWVGTEDAGISVLEHGRFRQLPVCDGHCLVHQLFTADGRGIWALTSVGTFRIDPDTLRATRVAGMTAGFHQSARIGRQVLMGGQSGLRRLSEAGSEPVPLPDGHRSVNSMLAAGDAVWMILGGDLYRLDAGSGRWTFVRGGLQREARVLADGAGGYYLSDDIDGTRRLAHDGGETPLAGVERLQAVGIVADAGGALWIGTPGKGLWLRRSPRVDMLYSTAVPDAPGRVLAPDGAGGAWLVMGCASLWHLDAAGRQAAWPVEVGDADGCIHSLLHDAATGVLWIGLSGGSLVRLAGGRIERVATWPQEGQIGIWKLRDGTLRVAGRRFVGRLRHPGDGGVERTDPVAALAGMEVKRMLDARAGGVWMVGDRGAFRVVGDAVVERWTPAQGIDARFLRALHEDAGGVLWLGSYGNGLLRIEAGVARQYTEANGLFDDTVSCILPGADGRLWLAGNRGIGLLLGRKIGVDGPVMETLTADDGLEPPEFNGSAVPPCMDDGAGHLWFAMMSGFARVTPARLQDWIGGTAPTAYIDHAAVSRRMLDVSRPIELGVNAANLEIRYGAVDLLNPDKLRFRYRIAGIAGEEGDWIDAGSNRSLLLPTLPWGRLAFEVQARELGGAWSPPATLRLYRPKPWYRYQWVWMAMSLACLLTLLWMTRQHAEPDVDDALLVRLRQPDARRPE